MHYFKTLEAIQVQNTKADLIRQFRFIKNLVYKIHYKRLHLRIIKSLLIITLIVIGLITLTNSDILITLKGISFILLIIIWILVLVYFVWYLFKTEKVNSWIESTVKNALTGENKYCISFDEEKLVINTENVKSEVLWSFYKYYAEDSESIYLFSEKASMYSCTSISETEIGNEAINSLKIIARSKLTDVHTLIKSEKSKP